MMRDYIMKMVGIFRSYTFCLIGPVNAYIVDDTKSTTTEMKIPFCEPKSNEEFSANVLLQILFCTLKSMRRFDCTSMKKCPRQNSTSEPKKLQKKLRNYYENSCTIFMSFITNFKADRLCCWIWFDSH